MTRAWLCLIAMTDEITEKDIVENDFNSGHRLIWKAKKHKVNIGAELYRALSKHLSIEDYHIRYDKGVLHITAEYDGGDEAAHKAFNRINDALKELIDSNSENSKMFVDCACAASAWDYTLGNGVCAYMFKGKTKFDVLKHSVELAPLRKRLYRFVAKCLEEGK